MNYRYLGNSDLKVSVVGIGTWGMGGDFFGKVDDKQSIRAIQTAMEEGVNLIDTAPAYGDGHAEEVVGEAILGRREEVILATKVGVLREGEKFVNNLKPASIRQEIEDSLRRLNVDVIDLYQIHWPDPNTPIADTVNELMKIQKEGKFRYLGVSNFKPHLMDEVREKTDVVSLQPHYSLLRRDIEGRVLPYCIENHIGVLGYGTLASGILTGKFSEIPDFGEKDRRHEFYDYFKEPTWSKIQQLLDVLRNIAEKYNRPLAQVAIEWAFQQEGITSVLVGAKNEEQAKSNAEAGGKTLSDKDLKRIEKGYRKIFD
ncbi:MAG TPA: aldo/keto reductase [bacterium]|nr:aldo/keto reductase [bacterium]